MVNDATVERSSIPRGGALDRSDEAPDLRLPSTAALRRMIEQATGVTMETIGLPASDAIGFLIRAAGELGRPLSDIAAEVVDRVDARWLLET